MNLLARLDIRAAAIIARGTSEPRYPDHKRIPYSGRTLAGIRVTPDTVLTVPAAWACLRYISQTVAMLPWHVMREGKKGGEAAPSHPVDWLLYKRPNPEWTAFQFRETLTHWALRWGNGYAEIERDPLGRVVALWPLHPDRVRPHRGPSDLEALRPAAQLYYRIHNEAGPPTELDPADMYHIRGFGEGPVGVNVMEYAAESMGWARAAQLFGAAFFGGGMNVSAVVTSKTSMGPVAMARIKLALAKLYRGIRGEKTLFLDAGMEYKPIGIEPEKAQFLATNQHLIEEVCRWFGVPPHKIQHLLRSTFSNIEHQAIEAVGDCILPWAKRFEDEADIKLFGQNRPGYYTKINLNALLRGDSAARSAFYQALRDRGILSANDILRLEDMNTIGPEGDKRIVNAAYTTLEQIGEPPPTAPTPAPAEPAALPAMDEEVGAMRAIEIMAAIEDMADAA